MNPSYLSQPARTNLKTGQKKMSIILLVIILAVISVNIFMMHRSVPQSIRDQYPALSRFSNILYYSFLPFLLVLPVASLMVALVLGFVPFRHYRYKEKLLTIFLGLLLIFRDNRLLHSSNK